MKRYEKILIVIVAAFFLLQFFYFFFPGKRALFVFAIWLLALSYLIGGYWLFNPKEDRKIFFPVFSGIAFAAALFTLPYAISALYITAYDSFSPLPNGFLFIVLTVYLIVNRSTGKVTKHTRYIFRRSAILLFISALFMYTPLQFKPFRKILMAINPTNESVLQNLLIIDHTQEYESALAKGDCNRAVEFALKANEAGKRRLGIEDDKVQSRDLSEALKKTLPDSVLTPELKKELEQFSEQFSNTSELNKIGLTYNNLYEAYKCRGNNKYNKRSINEALEDYRSAYKYLTAVNHNSPGWKLEKSWALNNIALCYVELDNYEMADSLYSSAIKNYRELTDSADYGLAELYSNFSRSLSEARHFSESTDLLFASNSILRKDTTDETNRKNLTKNYNSLSKNYLMQDSLNEALFYINRAMKFADKAGGDYCITTLLYSVCLYKLDKYQPADSALKTCLQCLESQPKGDSQGIAECNLILGHVNIALAKYDDARKYLDEGIKITEKNFGSHHPRYASHLKVSADLHKIMGEYTVSGQQYSRAAAIYFHEAKDRNSLPTVLAGWADLEITLSDFQSAKAHSDSSLAIAIGIAPLTSPGLTSLLCNAAYVDYCIALYKSADTLYKKVIDINANYGLGNTATTAFALSGLGLLETEKRNYSKADSLFSKSLELHQLIFTDNNPATAIVYLNYGTLCIHQKRFSEAEENIQRALSIDRQFFKDHHDVFADLFAALGDLAKKQNQNSLARDHYQKALDIYKKKFNDSHWKVLATQRKLR